MGTTQEGHPVVFHISGYNTIGLVVVYEYNMLLPPGINKQDYLSFAQILKTLS